MIKKLLSLVICASLALSSHMVFAEELKAGDEYKGGIQTFEKGPSYIESAGTVFFSDISDYSKIGLLSSLGIMSAYEDNLFKPAVYVSRGQFVEGMLKLLKVDYSNAAKVNDNFFYDVDESCANYNAITVAYDMGLISGFENNSFKPDSVMEYEDAISLAIRVLGYNTEYSAAMTIAGKIRLTKDISVNNPMAITRAEMAKILYNTLTAPTNNMHYSDERVSYTYDGDTLLDTLWHITESEGVAQTSFTETLCDLAPSIHSIVINNERYYTDVDAYQFFMGYYIHYYYDENDKLVYAYKSDDEVKEIEIDADDVIGFDDATRTFKYYEKGKSKSRSLKLGYNVIYNGMVPTEGFTTQMSQATSTSIFNIAQGKIKLVSNDNGRSYTTVFVEEYTNHILKKTTLDGNDVDLVFKDGVVKLNLDDTYLLVYGEDGAKQDVYRTTDKGEDIIDVSSLKTDAVLSIYTEYKHYSKGIPTADTAFVRIMVSSKKSDDVLLGYDEDDNTITVGDSVYKLAKHGYAKENYLDLNMVSIGSKKKLYVDFYGAITGLFDDAAATNDWEYVYLIKVNGEEDTDKYSSITVYDTGEVIKEYTLDPERVVINTKRVENRNVLAQLKQSAAMYERSVGDMTIVTGGNDPTMPYCSQLIKLKTNEGKVTAIRTITQAEPQKDTNYDEDQLYRSYATTKSSGLGGGPISVASDGNNIYHVNGIGVSFKPGVIFNVPSTYTSDPNMYSVVTISSERNMIMDLFDTTNLVPKVAVKYTDSLTNDKALRTGNGTWTAIPVMLGKTYRAVDSDGMVILKFEAVKQGSIKEYYTEDVNLLKNYKMGDIIVLYGPDDIGSEVTRVTPILYNGKVLGIDNLPWDAIETGDKFNLANNTQITDATPYAYEVYSVIDSSKFVLQNGGFTDGYKRINQIVGNKRNAEWQYGGVLLYTETEDSKPMVKSGAVEDLIAAENYGTDRCSIVIGYQHDGGSRQYYVYNFKSNTEAKNK